MVNVQDFGTDELIAALKERGFDVLTKDKEASIRAEERGACAAKVRKLADERTSLSENSDTPEFYSGQAAVLRIAEEAIFDRSKGDA